MNYYIIMYLSCLIEYIVSYMLSLALIGKKQQIFTKRLLTILFVPIIATILAPLLTKHFLYTMVCIPLEIATLMFCLRIKLKDYIEIFVIYYIIMVVFIQVPLTIALSFFNITNEMTVYIIGSLLTLLTVVIIYFIVPLNKLYILIRKQNQITRLIISNICPVAILITIYFKAQTASFYDNMLVILVTILVLIFVNVEIIVTRTHIVAQHKQLEAYNSYLPIIEQLIREVRQRQHNHDNDIQAIQSMPATYKTYDELSNAIKCQGKHMLTSNMPSNLLKLNTKLIAGFIFSKCNMALDMKKKLVVNINNYTLVSVVPEYELITLMGILIDNALEATPEEKTAIITLDSYDNKIVFKTCNIGPKATPNFIDTMFSEGYTTKHRPDNTPHGLGLPSLLQFIKKYDGEITVDNETIANTTHICFEIVV